MKTFKDLTFKELSDGWMTGVQARMQFDNGYGVSVVSTEFSYGGRQGLYELAVLDSEGYLHFDNPIACGDVKGYLTEDQVTELLIEIQNLKHES